MAAQQKNLAASGVMYTDRRDFYPHPQEVAELIKSYTPFLRMSMEMPKIEFGKDPQFKMFQHRTRAQRQYLYVNTGGTVNTADSSLTLTNTYRTGFPAAITEGEAIGLHFEVYQSDGGTVPKPLPGSYVGTIYCSAFVSNTSMSFKATSSDSLTVPTPAFLECIGTLFGEGSEAPGSPYDELEVVWNQAAIMRNAFQITNVAARALLRGDASELIRLQKECFRTHQMQKERALLWSRSPIGTNLNQGVTTYHASDAALFADGVRTDTAGNTVRSTYGAAAAINDYGVTDTGDQDQNIFHIASAGYSYSDYVDNAYKLFKYSDIKQRPVFGGYLFQNYWSKLNGPTGAGISGKSNWNIHGMFSGTKNSRMGFDFREVEAPSGIIQLVPLPSFDDSTKANYGFAPDFNNMAYGEYEQMQYAQNILTNNNPLLQKNEYVSQPAVAIKLLPAHKLFILD